MQVSIGNSSFEGVREVGGFGQPLHLLYPQIQAVLSSELGPEVASAFAEPVVDRASNRIDWYAQGDPDQKPIRLDDLPENQRQPVLDQIGGVLERGQELVKRYAASNDPRRVQLGAMLKAVLHPPAITDIFLVQGQPVIIGWGFALDRPWDITASPISQTPPPAAIAPVRDIVIPDSVAIPDRANATAVPALDLERVSSPVEPPIEASPSIPIAPFTQQSALSERSPESLPEDPSPAVSAAPPHTELPSPLSLSSPVAVTPTADVLQSSSVLAAEAVSLSAVRYVVVGSRPFWSIFALAVLLALMAVLWLAMGRSLPQSIVGATLNVLPDAMRDQTLIQAQHAEQELRARLEPLLTKLAERRSQCARSSGTNPIKPAVQSSEPAGIISTIPSPATDASGQPRVVAPLTVGGKDTSNRAQPSPGAVPVDVTHSKSAMPAPAPSSTASASRPTAEQPLDQTLEDALTRRESTPAAPTRRPPPVSSAKVEPTSEERQEFSNRMSATGAATGEITATLLWNSPGDLDLVVRCPSGQQLDYRNPAECGGTLDVDANATRANLSARPVENAFWPAGNAAPGHYEIAVRYTPRKDEQNPQETPFQVRLIRGGQESVFKGTVRPNTVTPVTTFTIDR